MFGVEVIARHVIRPYIGAYVNDVRITVKCVYEDPRRQWKITDGFLSSRVGQIYILERILLLLLLFRGALAALEVLLLVGRMFSCD